MSRFPDRVLHIDMSEKSSETVEEPQLFEDFLGGSALAISLLLRECPRGTDPFSAENIIVLAPGPFGGVFPCGGKTVATFKSPITGNLGESHAGGRLATCMRLAGYGAIVIKGSSAFPVFLEISSDEVNFRDATPLKGFASPEVERRLRGCAELARLQSIVSVGQAGENRVAYACVNVDRYNYFGRLGLGAVFGSKNLKAVSVMGTGSIKVPKPDRYKQIFKKIYAEIVETDKMAKYHFEGTPANVLVLNEIKALPTKNFQEASFEYAEEISGETLGKSWLEKKTSCPMCPIGCMHVAKLKPSFASGYEYEPIDVYHNYESVYALGSNLCIRSAEEVLNLIHTANMLGVDTMLIGNVLAWATEAFEKGIISKKETNGLAPRWGDAETYLNMTENIVSKTTGFYESLAQGVENAAKAYGGQEFAVAISGNGPAGYHTGYAFLLGTLVGGRHSHNNNGGYDIDQKILQQKMRTEQIAEQLIKENNWRYALTSLVICLFARRIYTEKRVTEALKVLGIERSVKELEKLGEETYRRAFEFKFREGFDFGKVKIPCRFFESSTANGKLDENTFNNILGDFIRLQFNTAVQG